MYVCVYMYVCNYFTHHPAREYITINLSLSLSLYIYNDTQIQWYQDNVKDNQAKIR